MNGLDLVAVALDSDQPAQREQLGEALGAGEPVRVDPMTKS